MNWKQFFYGVCYYPEHWDSRRHASDIRRMADAGFNVVRLGEGAWAYWEPKEGQFQFDMFDRVIAQCRKHGIKVIMGTPTYCAPAWVATKYPQVLRWNYQRTPMAHGSRRNFNYTSPKYLDLSDKLCTALAQHYKRESQIIAWQLDNEFNCHMDVSYAPSDTAEFRLWLKQKYRTIQRLNDAWGTRFWSQTYDDWEQIDLPHPTATYHNPTQLLDETRFISDMVVRFAGRQAAILRKANPKWQITHNDLFANISGPDLVKQLDFFCADQYPCFSQRWEDSQAKLAQARSFSFPYGILEQQAGPGGQMTYLHETPRPGVIRLWAWQSIAHGASIVEYFRWRTCPYGSEQHWHGLLDPDDRDNRRLAEAKQVGGEVRKLPREFLLARPAQVVGVLRDFDNETNDRRINTYTKSGSGEPWGWLAELARRHVPGDFLWPDSDLSPYRMVIAPHLKIMPKSLVAKLTQYVRSGGTLVLGAQSGLKDVNCHLVQRTPPGLLQSLAGVEVEDWSTLPAGATRSARMVNGAVLSFGTFVERLRRTKASPLARWSGDDALLDMALAVTVNRVGNGQVFYVGGYSPAPTIALLMDYLCEQLAIRPVVSAGPMVEAVQRTAGKRMWLCLLNHSGQDQTVRGLGDFCDILTGERGSAQTILPPHGVRIVRVQPLPNLQKKASNVTP